MFFPKYIQQQYYNLPFFQDGGENYVTDEYAPQGNAIPIELPVEATSPSYTQYNKKFTPSNYKGISIVDYLQSNDMNSSFASRKKLAESYGIKNYKGTSQQNLNLLSLLNGNSPNYKASIQNKKEASINKQTKKVNKKINDEIDPNEYINDIIVRDGKYIIIMNRDNKNSPYKIDDMRYNDERYTSTPNQIYSNVISSPFYNKPDVFKYADYDKNYNRPMVNPLTVMFRDLYGKRTHELNIPNTNAYDNPINPNAFINHPLTKQYASTISGKLQLLENKLRNGYSLSQKEIDFFKKNDLDTYNLLVELSMESYNDKDFIYKNQQQVGNKPYPFQSLIKLN